MPPSGGVAVDMAHAHGMLARTNTAPVFSSRSAGSSLPALSQTMSHNSRSSQLSGTTAYTTSSTASLSSMTSSATLVRAQPNGGQVIATNNIINQRADASRSLYQICVNLRQRLAYVPGFSVYLEDSDEEDDGEDINPVSSLWSLLQKGTPLLTIYNTLQPPEPIRVDDKLSEIKKPKAAAFKFVEACMKGLKLPPGECFALSDLFGDDTTGFVKVTQVVNHVLDVAEQRGLLSTKTADNTPATITAGSQMSYRDHVVRELVDTERKYVQDLENLHELKKKIEQKGVIPGDVVHDIFLNINAILDFQRRFLIKIETTNSQPKNRQEWGLPFANYEEAFGIYQPFIANQRKAADIAKREFDKIVQADHPVVVDFNTLDGFLLKPMQRLVKYPMLLKDLRDKTDADVETKADLSAGMESANRVLTQANAAVDRELRNEALADLRVRVDDWKNHRVDHFGDLLLYGHFPVVTGKSDVQKEVRPTTESIVTNSHIKYVWIDSKCKALKLNEQIESTTATPHPDSYTPEMGIFTFHRPQGASGDECHRDATTLDIFLCNMALYDHSLIAGTSANELGITCPHFVQYTIYLFERILLCCKEVNPNKSKDKIMGAQKDKKDKKDKNKSKEPNKNAKLQLKGRIFMTNVTEVLSLAKQGSYSVQIFWKGDPGVENFIIRFSNEESMKKWYAGVDGQRKEHASTIQSGSSPDAPPPDFAWMRDQTSLQNPYAQQDDDDEDDDYNGPTSTYGALPRNASSSSLRSRSTTGESTQSLASIARAPPPRFPMPVPPLSLQTQLSNPMPSPGQRGGDSYFSPVAESPVSSRTSTTSSMFPFPRQGTPQGGWEDNNRYTAPAMGRAPSRGSQTPADTYQVNGRGPQRPSLPAQPREQPGAAQQRSRSYSTPDVNAPNGGRRVPNGSTGGQVPAVPGIPAHLHQAYDSGVPRSSSNSPNGLPVRASTQSPGVQRERLAQASQYSNGPQYGRSNTTQIPLTSADSRTMSPPLGSAKSGDNDVALPTQLKVKVNCDGNYVTLVVAFNITYQSLIDRIDAKVGRFSNNAIARGTMRLRYRDEDGDFVTIESDDDIQIAFQEWREAQKHQYHTGQLGEIELFCLSIEN